MKTRNSFKELFSGKMPSILVVSMFWLLMIIVFSILSPYFFNFKNIMNLIQYASISGVAAFGFTFVILSGSLDLSAGMLSALASVYAARVVGITGYWWLGVITGIAIGILGGLINGLLITRFKVNPLIATLGTMTIFQGIANLENGGSGIAVYDQTYKQIGQGYIFGVIPIIVVIMFVIFGLFYVVLKHTKFGREAYSVGGNANASYVSGINVKMVRFKIFIICSLCAGCSGVLFAGLTGSGTPNANPNLVLDSISAIILGGTALTGGRGSIFGTIIGVLLIATIQNGLTLLNVSSFYQMIGKGLILIFAVYLDVIKGQGAYE